MPEALIGRVRLGDKLAAHVATSSAALEGVVSEIAPTADPASRTFLVKLDLPPATMLRSGHFARVAVPVGEISLLRVAATAVVQRGQMELVFVETNRVAQMRLVKTGKRVATEVELVSGVDAGAVRFRPMLLTAMALVVGAAVILADPIFQGLAIALMAGEIASLLISRMAVPVLYFMANSRRQRAAPGLPRV